MLSISGRHLTVQLVHLELVLEVRDRAQALHDRLGAVLARELDDQGIKGFYLHIGEFRDRLLDEPDALIGGEERLLLAHGWFTTATITLSNTPAVRLMMSRWPNVTGS